MFEIKVRDSPKLTREALCSAQAYLSAYGHNDPILRRNVLRLQALIEECDRHRPLGRDGKHGDLHTETCGCEDK